MANNKDCSGGKGKRPKWINNHISLVNMTRIFVMIMIVSLIIIGTSLFTQDTYSQELALTGVNISETDNDWFLIDSPEEIIFTDQLWRITFNRVFDESEIAGIEIEQNGELFPITVNKHPEHKQIIIEPGHNYNPNSNYSLNILLGNDNKYKMAFTTSNVPRPQEDSYYVTGSFEQQIEPLMTTEENSTTTEATTTVAQVALIYADRYEIIEVEDDTFLLDMERGLPGGIAFVDDDGNFLGHLDLGDGISGIPGQAVEDDIAIIDLGEITFDGDNGVPEYNPIGHEINIAEQDLKSMAVAGTFFSALAMNPALVESMVKDGQFIAISPIYYPDFGDPEERTFLAFNSDGSIDEAALQELKVTTHRLSVHFSPGYNEYKDLKIKYPSGLEVAADIENNPGHVFFPPVGYNYHYEDHYAPELSVPEPGEYRLYDSESGPLDIRFDIPDISDAAQENLVIPLPQVHLDPAGVMVESISWEYYTPGGNKISKPDNIITRMDVQITAHSGKNNDLVGNYDFHWYHGPPLIASILEHDIQQKNSIDVSSEQIYWEDIGNIAMAYEDFYNIHYVVGFTNRSEEAEGNRVYVERNPAEGGWVDGDDYFKENEVVNIAAEPDLGWEFTGWSSEHESVVFYDPEALETTFIMPDQSATVTANFERP